MLKNIIILLLLLLPLSFLTQNETNLMELDDSTVTVVWDSTESNVFSLEDEKEFKKNWDYKFWEVNKSLIKVEESDADLGMDKKIDKTFGNATGWFVSTIFWGIPVGNVTDTVTLDLTDSTSKCEVVERNDTLFISKLTAKGREATSISKKLESDNFTINNSKEIVVVKSNMADEKLSFISNFSEKRNLLPKSSLRCYVHFFLIKNEPKNQASIEFWNSSTF